MFPQFFSQFHQAEIITRKGCKLLVFKPKLVQSFISTVFLLLKTGETSKLKLKLTTI